jgi:UDP-N-acetyl-D-mannosaminuronic acid dehydrogenase
VIGLGYIGLPTALLLARAGHDVVGVDINQKRVENIARGDLMTGEPGLYGLLNASEGRFKASTTVESADVFIICVPTPLEESMKVAGLEYVRKAAESIVPHLKEGNLVVVESTVPPGTSAKLILPILSRSNLDSSKINIAHCPERALPDRVIEEMTNNDRIIGGNTPLACNLAMKLYRTFVHGDILLTNLATAEFVKLMENTYRDVNIALINELAKVAEDSGIDIWEARDLANHHPRVNYVKPGPGVGGHCIAVDPWFLMANASDCRLISLAREVNDSMPNYVWKIVKGMINGAKNPTLTVLGVAYKGEVDDTRETPALKFITMAENEGYTVKCHDPLVKNFRHELYSLDDATSDSDCIVLITDHKVFRKIDPAILNVRCKNVVDTRNSLDHARWRDAGYSVRVLGCQKVISPSAVEIEVEQAKAKIMERNILA